MANESVADSPTPRTVEGGGNYPPYFRSRAAAASECAPGARCFTRGPYGAAGGWRKVRQDGSQGCEPVFRRYRDVPSKNPGTRPRTRKAGCLEGAPSGCRFSLATFSLDKQRESSSGADRRTKPLCRLRQRRSKSPLSPTPLPRSSKQGHPWPFPASASGRGKNCVRPSRATTTPRIHPPPIPLR